MNHRKDHKNIKQETVTIVSRQSRKPSVVGRNRL
jgi:hypothetical protein